MSIPQKQKDRERRNKRTHRKPTMSEMPIPTTKVFKDKRRKSRQEEQDSGRRRRNGDRRYRRCLIDQRRRIQIEFVGFSYYFFKM